MNEKLAQEQVLSKALCDEIFATPANKIIPDRFLLASTNPADCDGSCDSSGGCR